MVYYAEEDEAYQEISEVPYENQMEERLVKALGNHMQDSINRMLLKALRPFIQPLVQYRQHKLIGGPSGDTLSRDFTANDLVFTQTACLGGSSLAEVLAHMAALVLRGHEYG
ncbi:hypothetical protein NDU88_005972 [Pleurodeles waltl]|uniref:Uncharacterized protein n=1 Tax=Pleurodeles waltl TaxID=8319 RepID=A0AAV7MZ33_PLEWA|nr:hypothetical protein NDU88_005972 [Pleurodeles waltl]